MVRSLRLPAVIFVPGLRRVPAAGFVLLLFGLLALLALTSDRLSDHPLILLTLPLVFSVIFLSFAASIVSAGVASTIAAGWWLENGEPGGWFWLGSRVATYFLIAGTVAQVVRSRRRLARRISTHNELSLDLIATASFDGYFTQVNPAFTTTLGFTAEELLSRPLLDFVHEDDRDATLGAIAEQAEQGRPVFQFQNRYRTKDGGYRWLEWTSRPDADDRQLVAVARDITDRKRFEELEREQKQLLERAVVERTHDLEQARLETLQKLALAAEYRDDDTHHHTQRVGRTAAAIAAKLGWDGEAVRVLRLAAPLHDVGKLAVSDAILLKPGPLTDDEMDRMREHTRTGHDLLSGSDSNVLQLAAELALSHHERWDGRGYPSGLQGETIPPSGRIVAVADVFDALTHKRPYKEAWPVADAVDEIRRARGTQFDPVVVDAFLELDHENFAQAPTPAASALTP